MEIKVLFFGATADTANARESELGIGSSISVGAALDRLSERYPQLLIHKLLIAVNEEYADQDTLLKEGDEVAIFTAVSGG